MIFDKILIVTRPTENDLTIEVREKVIKFCEDNDIMWRINSAYDIDDKNLLIVSIGGDGTMLGAMRRSLRYNKAIVYGINTGTLGFLSEEFDDNLSRVFQDIGRDWGHIDERMALSATVYIDGQPVMEKPLYAINEFVLTPLSVQSVLTTKISINKKFVSSNIGSGALVATATGSTAMSLSSGGAIVSPSTSIMQVVPILPHTLTSRPVITSGMDVISLSASLTQTKNPVEIYGDGVCLGSYEKFHGNEIELRIMKHSSCVRVYRPQTWDFFNVLREKMKW